MLTFKNMAILRMIMLMTWAIRIHRSRRLAMPSSDDVCQGRPNFIVSHNGVVIFEVNCKSLLSIVVECEYLQKCVSPYF